ncbi:MAG TPA: di-heme enzyme [Rhodocyclaceae bacterium]|nr:di-heme enzyme [Rhodocyclaceae bacterium]
MGRSRHVWAAPGQAFRRLSVLLAAAALSGCGGGGTSVGDSGTAGDGGVVVPRFFPAPRLPEGESLAAERIELGRHLFYDKRLSGNGTQACGSCHHQDKAFTDGLPVAVGATGERHPRNAQALGNVVYNATLTWANPSLVTLEKQMETPLFGENPVEMGVNDRNRDEVLARIRGDARYPAMFAQVFPGGAEAIDWRNVIAAIASFQRSLIAGNSRYDRFLRGEAVLAPNEERGRLLFFGERAECFHCHGSFNFNDQVVHAASRVVETPFHNTGLYNIDGAGGFPEPNRGVFELTALPQDMGAFRAPSLRNVEVTGPYMHDGTIATLEDVLSFYAAGGRLITVGPHAGDGRTNPFKSDLIALIDLSPEEQADIVAFLKTLTDHEFLENPKHADPFLPWP